MKSIDSWTLDNFSISREFDSQKKRGRGKGWRRNYAIETSNRAASVRPCLAGQHLSLDKSSRNPPLPFSSIHQGELLSFVTAMNCRFLPHCYVIIISVSDYNGFHQAAQQSRHFYPIPLPDSPPPPPPIFLSIL